MHGRVFFLKELRYGFEEERFVVRVDVFPESIVELEDAEFRIAICAKEEVAVGIHTNRGGGEGNSVEEGKEWLLQPPEAGGGGGHRHLGGAEEAALVGFEGIARGKGGGAL